MDVPIMAEMRLEKVFRADDAVRSYLLTLEGDMHVELAIV